jgi:hypothetical protein
MKRILMSAAFVAAFCWFARAADAPKVLDSATQVLTNMASSNQIPSSVLSKSKCIAVIPKLTKAGLVVGGKHGNGVVSCRTTDGWSAPAFISVGGGSIGLQAGAEHQDIVLLMNPQGEQELISGHWDLGAEAVAAGPSGSTGPTPPPALGRCEESMSPEPHCMAETIRERWLTLFDQARHELDSAKLMALVAQINELLEEEEKEKNKTLPPRDDRVQFR